MTHFLRWFCFFIFFFSTELLAYSSTDGIEFLSFTQPERNPYGYLQSLSLEQDINPGYGPYSKTQYEFEVIPLLHYQISNDWNLINRITLPLYNQPSITHSNVSISGLGDISSYFFFSPVKHKHKTSWGIGPCLMIPTASQTPLGTGKWNVGPTVFATFKPNKLLIGLYAYNLWSVAGAKGLPAYDQLTFYYILNYDLPHGWYLTSAPQNIANWHATSRNRWTIPIGGGIGRVFSINKEEVHLSCQAYYNMIRPQQIGIGIGPTWQAEFIFSYLFSHSLS